MDYIAEQEQELEVLESIYPDELEVLNATYPDIKFSVTLKLELNDTAIHDNDLLMSLSKVHLLEVTFQFPETYPDMAPIIHINPLEQSLDDNSESDEDEDEQEDEYDEHGNIVLSKLENLADNISFKDYIEELTSIVRDQIDSDMLLGMQMCFALLATIKENAENWFLEQLDELDKQHTLEIERREAQEQKKFNGTPVTKESYLEWRATFRKEMHLDERDKLRRLEAHNGKLTGKQMFEQGVAGTIDDTDDAEIESMTKELDDVDI
ncbi:similar to Saccharomyces cerevisiae YDR152W GIR2 Highly-acidic cytoplasmic RWD domain- containing protein of unknown function [Maudiozyma barnettii]|uniref:RWD domain-containing protein n=1 Tax=Maudiozyma barnettii TaxID=61262 RepID=A0A8H2ZIM7_9SACH|nr:Gir2p [Kazachstania barnettii]CAB4255677.1 similar to Saccharomyces cerevisiae YDR152W GIR2 Highly-acidic cytoplasmic RWD domain- containing protein of unknown function [Kazachstania barnettii]CAD1784238.1 similar to Saccharomyces cerevisiae YDR152W GIR2 Highly-acidic cytoplasmic RWD domain- containing protein of unknown function [Kazachstania barnettii]